MLFFFRLDIITLCENDSINITCDGDLVIVVEDVLFGPWADNMHSSDPDSEDCSLTDKNSTRIQIDSLCSDRHTCLLNNSFDYFSLACPYVERKVNITYRCGEFSHNCNRDTCIYFKKSV